jgi:hypothetical protein
MEPIAMDTPHPRERYTLSATREPMRDEEEEDWAASAAMPPTSPFVMEGVGVGVACLELAPPELMVAVEVVELEVLGEAPRERVAVGEEVGEAERVFVEEVLDEAPTVSELVGVVVGELESVFVELIEAEAP